MTDNRRWFCHECNCIFLFPRSLRSLRFYKFFFVFCCHFSPFISSGSHFITVVLSIPVCMFAPLRVLLFMTFLVSSVTKTRLSSFSSLSSSSVSSPTPIVLSEKSTVVCVAIVDDTYERVCVGEFSRKENHLSSSIRWINDVNSDKQTLYGFREKRGERKNLTPFVHQPNVTNEQRRNRRRRNKRHRRVEVKSTNENKYNEKIISTEKRVHCTALPCRTKQN